MSGNTASTDTKTALIRAGSDLLLERSWTGFSYADLADQVGIRKASIHHHFPAKGDLGLAVIDAWQSKWSAIHDQAEETYGNVAERIQAVLDLFFGHVRRGKICPPGALDADFHTLTDDMRAACRAWSDLRLNRYAQWFAEGREQGSLHFVGDPADQALLFLSGLQGALQIDRTMDNDALTRFRNQVMASMAMT